MATLSGNKIKDTYQSLIKLTDNGNLTTGAKQLTDGFGNNSPLYISTTQIGIGVTPEATYDLHVYSNAKVGGNLTVTGDLTVEGTTTTIDTQTLTVEDPLIEVASNNTSTDAVDIGWYGKYAPSGTVLYAGLFRDTGDSKFKLFRNLQEQPTTTVNTSGTGYTKAGLVIGGLEATTGDFTDTVTVDGDIEVENSSGFGRIEIGGSSGAYIDLKSPFSDDFDLRLYTAGTNAQINAINGELDITAYTNINLQYQGTDVLVMSSTGVAVTGTGSFTGQVTIPETPSANTDAASKGYVDTTAGNYLPLAGGTMSGSIAMGSNNISGGGTFTATTFSGQLDGTISSATTATTQTAGDNSTKVATTAYVDSAVTEGDLDFAGDTGTGSVDLDSQTFTIAGGTNVTTEASGQTITINATGAIDGSGTANYVTKWSDTDTITNSVIYDNGNIGINETNPASDLVVRADSAGGRGGEITILNYASNTVGNEAALNFGLENSTYAGNDGNAQIKAIISGSNAATDMVFTNWSGSAFNEYMRIDSSGDTTFTGNVMPAAENAHNIGSAAVRWEDLFVDDGFIRDAYIDEYIYHNGDTNTYIRALPDEWVFRTGGDDRFTISNSNTYFTSTNVGIGETNPTSKLHVKDTPVATSGAILTLRNSQATASNTTFGGIFFNSSPGYDFSIGKANVNAASTLSFRNGNSGASLMDIDASGNVGIGETNPDTKLHINESTANTPVALTVESASWDSTLKLKNGNGTWEILNDYTGLGTDATLGFYNSGYRMIIDNTGKVGIGQTNPQFGLSMAQGTGDGSRIGWNDGAGSKRASIICSSSTDALQFHTGTSDTERMRITSGGELQVTGNGVIKNQESGGNYSYLQQTSSDSRLFVQYSQPLLFGTNATERMRIDSSGNVGINETSPRTKLEIKVDTSSRNTVTRALTLNANGATLQPYEPFGTGIIFEGYDYAGGGGTSTSRDYAYIDARMETSGSTPVDFSSRLVFATNSGGTSTTTPTNKMIISAQGNVGIGTESPDVKLDVRGEVAIAYNATYGLRFYNDARNNWSSIGNTITGSSSANLVFKDATGEVMRIATGNVGIGETSPLSDLVVRSDSAGGRGGEITILNYASTTLGNEAALNFGLEASTYQADNGNAQIKGIVTNASNAASQMRFSLWNGSSFNEEFRMDNNGDFHADGDVVAYSTTISDARLKDNVKPLESSLDKIMNLKGVEYTWNNGSRKGQKDIGFIAQEVEDVIPEIVREKKVIFDDDTEYKTVDYEKITAVLVEAVKELKQEIVELKKQIK